MRRVLPVAASIAAILLVVQPSVASAAGSATAGEVQVVVTTPDQSELLNERAPVAFEQGGSDEVTITVDPETEYQTMDGFGASITDSAASVLYRLSPEDRDATMRRLFDPEQGIGISFLRQPIGSSDFTAEAEHYTFDDVAPGRTDYLLRNFSIAHDRQQILPLLRQAKELNPDLTIMATPWSPPAWMKTGGSLIGGQLKDTTAVKLAYAAYLTKFVRAYAAAGVPIDYISVQNEPQNRTPDGYGGTDMPVEQQADVIRILGPILSAVSPRTKILGYDHNWATHPDDVANIPPGASPQTDYPYALLDTRAARWITGTAYHCYYGDPSAMTAMHEAHPEKGIWFTECSASHGADDPQPKFFRDTLTFHARNIMIGTPRNWAKSAVTWNIALDQRNGPFLGGCTTCTGLLTVNDDGSVDANAEFYTIGHLAKFVKPGATRIASTSFGTTGWNGQIMDVAFRNPDGSTALVVHNLNDDPRTFAVAEGDRSFDYTLPGGAIATFTWQAGTVPDDGLTPVAISGATATAGANAQDAALAIDADGSTRWSSGTAQRPGLDLTVDLGEVQTFRRVAIDSGGNAGDFARGWALEISADGAAWRPLASGTGTGQSTDVDVPQTSTRYLRVSTTADSGNWWSIADLRLYR